MSPEKNRHRTRPEKPSATHSDEEVVSRFGMSLDEVESEAKQIEDANIDDALTGVFYYGSPIDRLKDDEAVRK